MADACRISITGWRRLLLFLLQVICALVEQRQCVPYRDSALTHILKDSLGGSARATVRVLPHYWPTSGLSIPSPTPHCTCGASTPRQPLRHFVQVVLCLHDREDAAAFNTNTLRVGAQLQLVRNKPKCDQVSTVSPLWSQVTTAQQLLPPRAFGSLARYRMASADAIVDYRSRSATLLTVLHLC